MSLNQLLYAPGVATNHRKWMDVIIDSLRFGAKSDGNTQRVLDYYAYNPDAADELTLAVSAGAITGSMTVDVCRLGRMVTIVLNTPAQINLSQQSTFTATALAANMRPPATTSFCIPATFAPDAPSAYGLAKGLLLGEIGTNGVITFDAAYFLGTQIGADPAAYYGFTRLADIPGGDINIENAAISYLHAV